MNQNIPAGSLILATEMEDVQWREISLRASDVGEVVRGAARRAGFQQAHFSCRDTDGSFTGTRRMEFVNLRSKSETLLLVRWRMISDQLTRIEWATGVPYGVGKPVGDLDSRLQFEHWFVGELDVAQTRPRPIPPPENPVVPPGVKPPLSYIGQIYDYSVLAPWTQLTMCHSGTLPIGREAFGIGSSVKHGALLFLPLYHGLPREELGVLVCAPQGFGKTWLMLTWAATAASQGKSVFLVDVKGNMRGPLEKALELRGVNARILQFATAMHQASHSMNLLAGISASETNCAEQLKVLAEAVLPFKQSKREKAVWEQYALRVLTAAMQLLKLLEFYGLLDGEPGRAADLSDLHWLIVGEDMLIAWIVTLQRHEATCRANDRPLASYPAEECLQTLALVLSSHDVEVTNPDGSVLTIQFRKGRRPPERMYEEYMVPILNIIDSFRRTGYMAERVRSTGTDDEIRLDTFGRDGVSRIVLLSARENEGEMASAILGMAMRRLRQVFDERRELKPTQYGQVLLILDETSRINGFDIAEHVSYTRENHVGYAVCYQSLDMIAPDRTEAECTPVVQRVLKNIGTQIYLGGLSGYDLDQFNYYMANRDRDREMENRQNSPSAGSSRGSSLQTREVPFLQAIAAKSLPAGARPALISLRDHGPAPFLVDLKAD